MFKFSANDQFLLRVARHLREAPDRVRRDFAARAEVALQRVVDEQFESGSDPFGRPYAPPKDGHSPPMVRSGALWRGLRVHVAADGSGVRVSVSSAEEYAKYLQHGTRRMQPRLIVPGTTVLSAKWRAALLAAQAESVRRWYGAAALTR